ncbi:MAG: AAA family ATPase [Armatimonadota bacterium]
MRMVAFRVENFRSVIDSGWVDVDDLTVIVGKNESGKTSILRALWKFNPFKEEPYDLGREWPRGRRREMSEERPVTTVRFDFTPDEQRRLWAIDDTLAGITGAEISRNYQGTYTYQFLPKNPDAPHPLKWAVRVVKQQFGRSPESAFAQDKARFKGMLDAVMSRGFDDDGRQFIVQPADQPARELPSVIPVSGRPAFAGAPSLQTMQRTLDSTVATLSVKTPARIAVETVHGWMPTFIYMDDYKVFKGSTQLDQMQQRKDLGKLCDEDLTLLKIMEMAGLDLEEEYRKGLEADKEQRILDMNDASQTLTDEIAHRWSQKKYEVVFQADGQHFLTFVKDSDTNILVPLEERSKGFQWFFSFDMTFMYETNGDFENAVILLDEPGLHLHAAAQRDLQARLRAYAENNQLLFTTHLPFMIDLERLENVCIAEDLGDEGTRLHKNWAAAGQDARYTLQAAFSLSWSQSLFSQPYNLVVSEVSDLWYLTAMSAIMTSGGRIGLDERITITPAGGAGRMAVIGAMLQAEQRDVAVLLDDDEQGRAMYRQLIDQWLLDESLVLLPSTITHREDIRTLEDLFPAEYYLKQVREAYRTELGNHPLVISDDHNLSLVDRVRDALLDRRIPHFDRARIARNIVLDLAKKSLAECEESTIDNFACLFAAINAATGAWLPEIKPPAPFVSCVDVDSN